MHRRPVKGGTGWDCKAEGAKAAGLYYEIANVGKVVEASKKRITWRIKMEEGKEYEISLTHSIASGKKVLRIDGIVTYQSSSFSLGDWDYCFNLGNHVIHILIKPSVELNDSYDLIVDGISFRRLPEDVIKPKTEPVVHRSKKNLSREPSASDMSASGSWECSACTLINEKPLAPVCEACGAPKPKFAPVKQPSTKAIEHKNSSSSFNAFDAPSAPPSASSWVAFDATPSTTDPFAANAFAPPPSNPPQQAENIASMLHGLDFNYTPPPQPQPTEPAVAEPVAEPAASLQPQRDPLWDASIVDLNLNPESKLQPLKSTKSMQSMEQARLATAGSAKQLVMTPPQPPPVYLTFQPPPAYQPSGFPPQQHIVAPPMGGGAQYATYNMNMGMGVQPRVPQQQFMMNMTNAPPPVKTNSARPNLADPFATLS
ncbi:unnamed protein product [Aphanomyces euteiches]|uniref:RanBP2-type domain-containing protein n=1 Tax=Aphanomyces euteiches TaxID=100861 RepID=A0A6G0WGT2_9STRA|nr:hypothetical protein Ae201684_015381 [Aphanomyces euteiches]KAH9155298.1 hypothetical protein AeRB84_002720 [Aphanomyces euteiches]